MEWVKNSHSGRYCHRIVDLGREFFIRFDCYNALREPLEDRMVDFEQEGSGPNAFSAVVGVAGL